MGVTHSMPASWQTCFGATRINVPVLQQTILCLVGRDIWCSMKERVRVYPPIIPGVVVV